MTNNLKLLKKKVEIPKDKTKMAGYLSIPDADIKTPVYPGGHAETIR